ncbi:MAG: ParB/RepB/Spo0J family partition protein [Proteobacteria bacterium]|nr:ParB/RepB/Spo0J family partition protein [Pseudomonadota bacterium]MCL2309127.1 ParB/RepB/Spo0J family partition protein [Pseudomonadota bacterium]
MIRPKGLGRGLDSLIPPGDEAASAQASELQTVAIARLQPGKYQPRTRMDEASLNELAESIREQGLMQPILVRAVSDNRYEIIAGERRWRAAQRAGLKEVPVLVKTIPDQTALAWALIENIQRENLNPLEEAQGLQRLIGEFSLTHEDAAKAVGRSRSAVSNLLRLLQLSESVQAQLNSGALEMGHARALLVLPNEQQAMAASRIVEKGMSVREAERLVHAMLRPPVKKKTVTRDADLARLETELSEQLGAKVQIETGKKGAGKLIIHYANLDTLDGILEKLR